LLDATWSPVRNCHNEDTIVRANAERPTGRRSLLGLLCEPSIVVRVIVLVAELCFPGKALF
jgi:hypothetical protein